MKRIELVLGYECNCDCVFCATDPALLGHRMSLEQAVDHMQTSRAQGASHVDFGGGEPTIRKDLPALTRAAATLGFETIGIRSNGLLFCYPDFARNLLDAGMNRFEISVWGPSPETHDAFSQIQGSFDMMEMGVKHLIDFGADVELGVLLTNETVPRFPDMVRDFEDIGVRKFILMMFCLFGANGALPDLYPRLTDAGKAVNEAFRNRNHRETQIRSSRIPPCFLPDAKEVYFDIRKSELLVITPGHSFMAEESPFEFSVKTDRCMGCRMYDECGGVRAEYIDHFSDAEIRPIGPGSGARKKRGRSS